MAKSFAGFCKTNNIKALSIEADFHNGDWGHGATHWMVTLIRPGNKKLTTEYHMGSAHTGKPKADQVLWSLVQDAESFHSARNFEEWANEYGYDTDSRKAEQTYKDIEKIANKLHDFLGELYQEAAKIEE